MTIKKSKGAITITLEKELIDKLRDDSDKNRRTLSNEIAIIIEEYLKRKENNLSTTHD